MEQRYWQNYINGEWVDGSKGRLPVENPATGEVIAEVALAGAEDVDAAIQAAEICHNSRALIKDKPFVRGRMVRGMGEWLTAHRDEIAEVLTLESGKPIFESLIEVDGAARFFEYYGNQAETLEGRSIPLGDGYLDFTVYEPFGVTGHIIPWNFPLDVMCRGLGPALAAGNTCVIKTPELTPLSCIYVARAAEAVGLPAGAINMLCGLGADAGAALSSHRGVRQLVFTGSVATGKIVAKTCADNAIPTIMELGGKSAAIAYEDCDIDALVEQVRWANFYHCGQICSAMSRLVVHRSIHDQVVERIVALADGLKQGPGIEDLDMGSMMNLEQRSRAHQLVEKAVAAGAKLECGGVIPEGEGAFYPPTVITGVDGGSEIAQQEVFGPVLVVISFDTEDEAIAIANHSDYGLVGGVFTQNLNKAMRVAQLMQAGQIFVNEWFIAGCETPFGGYKLSGYGREKGRQALMNYVQTKNIGIKMPS